MAHVAHSIYGYQVHPGLLTLIIQYALSLYFSQSEYTDCSNLCMSLLFEGVTPPRYAVMVRIGIPRIAQLPTMNWKSRAVCVSPVDNRYHSITRSSECCSPITAMEWTPWRVTSR